MPRPGGKPGRAVCYNLTGDHKDSESEPRSKRGIKGQAPFLCKPPLYYPFTANGLICEADKYATAGWQALQVVVYETILLKIHYPALILVL